METITDRRRAAALSVLNHRLPCELIVSVLRMGGLSKPDKLNESVLCRFEALFRPTRRSLQERVLAADGRPVYLTGVGATVLCKQIECKSFPHCCTPTYTHCAGRFYTRLVVFDSPDASLP